mgnify:CR=1 FL=1
MEKSCILSECIHYSDCKYAVREYTEQEKQNIENMNLVRRDECGIYKCKEGYQV